jgi:hypothetical protein
MKLPTIDDIRLEIALEEIEGIKYPTRDDVLKKVYWIMRNAIDKQNKKHCTHCDHLNDDLDCGKEKK